MPSNPIQRKTRNAFLLGMLLTLIVAIIVIAMLYLAVFRDKISEKQSKESGGIAYVYKLTSSVKSGEEIQLAKVVPEQLFAEDVPADFIDANYVTNLSAYKSKVALQAGTILSASLLYQEEATSKSLRLMEYNMITFPSTLSVGDYVDVRFTMPSGQDFIVLAKKQVKSLRDSTVTFYLTEDEILMMSSAIIESYIMNASNLHIVQYVEAGLQDASIPTYSINTQVLQLIQQKNGINIEDYGKINSSYNEELRRAIEREIAQYESTKMENIEQKMDTEKKTAMELYLSGLAGY